MAKDSPNVPGEAFSKDARGPMSPQAMTDAPPLVVRERKLSNAATHHLLSKDGSAAGLAAAMSGDVKRIKAGLDARLKPDIVAVDSHGRIHVIEVKRSPKGGLLFGLIGGFGKAKGNKAA
jgi:hypothetical protein